MFRYWKHPFLLLEINMTSHRVKTSRTSRIALELLPRTYSVSWASSVLATKAPRDPFSFPLVYFPRTYLFELPWSRMFSEMTQWLHMLFQLCSQPWVLPKLHHSKHWHYKLTCLYDFFAVNHRFLLSHLRASGLSQKPTADGIYPPMLSRKSCMTTFLVFFIMIVTPPVIGYPIM